jgi:DNA replication protein DnaC
MTTATKPTTRPINQDGPINNHGPNNEGGPIYGPPTEKEYLRAIKHAANEKLAEAFDTYKAAKDALPPEPSKKHCEFAFTAWLEANHRAAYDHEQKRISYDERQKHQREVIEPLFEVWTESAEGREIGGPRLAWEKASAAIEAAYKAARAPHEASIEEARKRWDEIQKIENIRAIQEKAQLMARADLYDAMGHELAARINVDHPDFDRVAFDALMAWDWFPGHHALNGILHGQPGTGKSRAMGAWALGHVLGAEEDFAWITGAQFAELVAALADNEQRAEARRTLRRLADAYTLFFDDLGSAHFTPARISHFFAMIDHRYKTNGPTLFTTNHGLKEIRAMLSGSGSKDDTTMADRILRRIIGTPADPRCTFFEFKRRKSK